MWPLKRKRDVLRVGRDTLELWSPAPTGYVLRSHQAIDPATVPREGALAASVRSLLATATTTTLAARQAARSTIDVVLESAWLPTLLLEVGRTVMSERQNETLLRHRLSLLYGRAGDPVETWTTRVDYRPGEAHAMGFGLAPSVRQAVTAAVESVGCRPGSLQPAFTWARATLKHQRRVVDKQGWWLSVEQDRTLVCRVLRERIVGINAGAPVPADDAQCRRLVDVESARLGVVEANQSVVVARWSGAPRHRSAQGATDLLWASIESEGIPEGEQRLGSAALGIVP